MNVHLHPILKTSNTWTHALIIAVESTLKAFSLRKLFTTYQIPEAHATFPLHGDVAHESKFIPVTSHEDPERE
jgi:hypothetical protein